MREQLYLDWVDLLQEEPKDQVSQYTDTVTTNVSRNCFYCVIENVDFQSAYIISVMICSSFHKKNLKNLHKT